jgi:hypothetical protein
MLLTKLSVRLRFLAASLSEKKLGRVRLSSNIIPDNIARAILK